MTTATTTGEHPSLRLPQFGALSIADPPSPAASASPNGELPGDDAGAGRPGGAAGDAAPPRKAWNSPPRRTPDLGGAVFMEEPCSSWPVPSRDGASTRKKHPRSSEKEAPPAAAAATVAAATSSSPESVPNGDPVARSVEISSPGDQLPPEEEGDVGLEQRMQSSDMVAVAAPTQTDSPPRFKGNSGPRTSRPLLRPPTRQPQQSRPPMQNGHRGRNQQNFPHPNSSHSSSTSNSGSHQQQRPRNQRNPKFFPHQRPTHVNNDNSYNPMMAGFLVPPDWGFNPVPNLQWGPNPHLAPPHMNTLAPPENMFLHGFLPGPYFADGPPYSAAPLPPITRPPLVQNPPWFMAHPHPPAEPVLQNQHAYPSPPQGHRQPPPDVTQQVGVNVDTRLRQQIEYYFSDQNLVKDVYLRRCMDNEGWVSVHTIANFPRVQSLTRDASLIFEVLQASAIVEVSVDKMRRKGDWARWLFQRQPLMDANEEASCG